MEDKKPAEDYTKPDAYMKERVARESYEDFIKKEMRIRHAAAPMELPKPARTEAEKMSDDMQAALKSATGNKEVRDVIMDITMGMMLSTLLPGRLGRDMLVQSVARGASKISALIDEASASK